MSQTVSSCFAALRQIHSVRRSVTRPVLLSLMHSLVLTRLDYGNATLAGLSGRLTARLQSVLHAVARLIYSKQKYEHITPLLMELHWLSLPECIQFKLAVLVFCCLHGTAPSYLVDQLQPVAALESCRRLRSSASARLDIPTARRTTIGDRAFRVASPHMWNSLSSSTQNARSLPVFRQLLKCEFFHHCYGSNLC